MSRNRYLKRCWPATDNDAILTLYLIHTLSLTLYDFYRASNQLIHRTIEPSITTSIDQLIHRSIHRSINPLIHRSFDRSIHPPINTLIHPSIHQSFNRSIHWSIYPSIDQLIDPSINALIDWSIHPSIHQTIHLSIQLIHQSIGFPFCNFYCQQINRLMLFLNTIASISLQCLCF